MDGWDDKSYAEYRNIRDGEYTKIMSNISAFKKLPGACRLGISYIIEKKNADKVFDFSVKIKEFGADSIKLSPCITSNSGQENNEYHKPIFEQVKAQTVKVKSELEDADFEVFDAYHELDEKFEKK